MMDAPAIIALIVGLIAICGTIGGAAWMIRSAMATMAEKQSAALELGLKELHLRMNAGDRDSQERQLVVLEKLSHQDNRLTVVETSLRQHIDDRCHRRPSSEH